VVALTSTKEEVEVDAETSSLPHSGQARGFCAFIGAKRRPLTARTAA